MNHTLSETLSSLLSLIHQQDAVAPHVIAVYGNSSHFERLTADFCETAQQMDNTLVVSFDIGGAACHSPADAVFAFIQQFFDALIKHGDLSEDRSQLLTAFYHIWNLSNTVKQFDKEERFAAFVRFTEHVAYPLLAALLRRSPCRIVCVVRAMEKTESWSALMHHFVFDTLLDALRDSDIRVILFSANERPPDLWYGSNEEEAADRIRFVRVNRERYAESLCGEI